MDFWRILERTTSVKVGENRFFLQKEPTALRSNKYAKDNVKNSLIFVFF